MQYRIDASLAYIWVQAGGEAANNRPNKRTSPVHMNGFFKMLSRSWKNKCDDTTTSKTLGAEKELHIALLFVETWISNISYALDLH